MILKCGEVEVMFELEALPRVDVWVGRWGALTLVLEQRVGATHKLGLLYWRSRPIYTITAETWQGAFEGVVQAAGDLALDIGAAFNGFVDLPGHKSQENREKS